MTNYLNFNEKLLWINIELSKYIDNIYYYEDNANISDRSSSLHTLSSLIDHKVTLNENLNQPLEKTELNIQDTILNYLLYILSIDYINLDEKKVKKISNGFLTSYVASRYDYNQSFKNQLSLIKNFINTNKNWVFDKKLNKDEIKLEKMKRLDNLFTSIIRMNGNVIVPLFLTKTGQNQDLDMIDDNLPLLSLKDGFRQFLYGLNSPELFKLCIYLIFKMPVLILASVFIAILLIFNMIIDLIDFSLNLVGYIFYIIASFSTGILGLFLVLSFTQTRIINYPFIEFFFKNQFWNFDYFSNSFFSIFGLCLLVSYFIMYFLTYLDKFVIEPFNKNLDKFLNEKLDLEIPSFRKK